MTWIVRKTANITAKLLSEINQEIHKYRTTVLQNSISIDYFFHKQNLGSQQFHVMYCVNVSGFPHITNGQIISRVILE